MELVSLIEGDVSELRIKMHFGFLIRGGRLIELTPEKGPSPIPFFTPTTGVLRPTKNVIVHR
jgi:hypothetical protein